MTEPRICSLCNLTESTHREIERAGRIQHQFTTDDGVFGDTLKPIEKPKPNGQKLLAIPDPALRVLLIEKGLITYDELAAKESEILGRQQVPTTPREDG